MFYLSFQLFERFFWRKGKQEGTIVYWKEGFGEQEKGGIDLFIHDMPKKFSKLIKH